MDLSGKGMVMVRAKGRRVVGPLIVGVLTLLAACSPRECTAGDNMTAPRLLDEAAVTAYSAALRITWDGGTELGAELGSNYFNAVTVEDETGIVTGARLSDYRELTVMLDGLAEHLAGSDELTFNLVFPDRRNYIDCQHRGMDDSYVLTVSLTFDADGRLATSRLEQSIRLGPV